MPSSIKAKTAAGISGLFFLLLVISVVGITFINLLSDKTEKLLTNNYRSIQYCNEMTHDVDLLQTGTYASVIDTFEASLRLQEKNITEPGENAATKRLSYYFEIFKKEGAVNGVVDSINKQLYTISILNQNALEQKNTNALMAARSARMWISILGAIILLVGFSFSFNFPRYISQPIKALTEGIREIANKNYTTRIHLDNKDEFGEMASAFNSMAEKLYEFEHSNISQLMFEKKRVESIINQMEDAVIGMDADSKVLFINHKAEGIFNLKAREITGKRAPDVALYNDLLRTILQRKQDETPLKIIMNGKENYFSIDRRIVHNEDKTIGEVFTLKNITSFKELDISKTNLLATISHELKTPISSIKMSTKLLNDNRTGSLNTEQDELVNNINDDAERLLRITAELLNITQIETGNIQLKIYRVAPKEIVDNALRVVQMQADKTHVHIRMVCPDTLPDVFADGDKTSWVLINFLTNAIKYSKEGSEIAVQVIPYKNMVQFSVQDFGSGIEEKYLTKIFDRYFKVPGQIEKTGTGLGLAISKEFIEAQNGQIEVKSEYGKGSIFSFFLNVFK